MSTPIETRYAKRGATEIPAGATLAGQTPRGSVYHDHGAHRTYVVTPAMFGRERRDTHAGLINPQCCIGG